MSDYGFATARIGQHSLPALVLEGQLYDLRALANAFGLPLQVETLSAMIADWPNHHDRLTDIAAQARAGLGTALVRGSRLDAAVPAAPFTPRRIFAAASNFAEHAAEMATALAAKADSQPYIFLKTIESIVGPDDAVIVPSQVSRPDWEVELGVVIGQGGKHIPVEAAIQHIAGYTIINDVSARDQTRRQDFPFSHDWFRGKSFDTFTPMGPWFVPREAVGDPMQLKLGLRVNDKVMQDGCTSEMIFTIAEQIAYLSTILELRAGDVLATGTPAGVGMGRGIFLQHGDVMTAWVEGLGTLTNPVVFESRMEKAA